MPFSRRVAQVAALLIAGCAALAPTAPEPAAHVGKFEPAPTPRLRYGRPGVVGALEIPLPPKMPLGTGAVPVGNGPFRGSIVTGVRQSF